MEVPHIAVTELVVLHAEGVVLIDVRMPDEYEEVHVPGAALIPLPEVAERVGEIPASETVYVICRSGARSLRACEVLRTGGIDAVNVAGGTLAWLEAGHAVVAGADPR